MRNKTTISFLLIREKRFLNMIKAMPGIIESWRTIGVSHYEVVKKE